MEVSMAQPDMIGIVVRDMKAALDFYRLVGLDIPATADKESHVECTANGYRIAWDTLEIVKGFLADWVEPAGHRMGMAFKCGSTEEVDALYHRLIQAGYRGRKEPWDAFWGQRYALVLDPDGNTVDLFARLS
jgi:uncharacterized glyoxalase superfamily protein PhnB